MQKETTWGQSVGKCNFLLKTHDIVNSQPWKCIRQNKRNKVCRFWQCTVLRKNSGKEACSGLSGMWKMVNMREVNCLWTKEASKAKCISIKCSRRSCSRSLSLTFNHIRPYLFNEKQLQKHSVYKMIIYQWKRLTVQLSVVWLAAVVRFSRTDMDCSGNVLALWPHHTTLVEGSVCAW